MLKKILLLSFVLISTLKANDLEQWRKNITMLAVPRDPQVLQIAQDIARRYPVLLVCYQQSGETLAIHAWNGENWVGVAEDDYTHGTFFTYRPKQAVIIEPEGSPAPEAIIPDGTWCPEGNRLTSTDPRVVIHLLGRYFDFPYRYWVQFARRYDYTVEAINPALINIYWFHWQGEDIFPKRASRDFKADMEHWFFLDIEQPEPVEPIEMDVEPVEILPAEEPAEEVLIEKVDAQKPDMKTVEEDVAEVIEEMEKIDAPVEETAPIVDPFSTNEVPAAEVILRSAD
jgi:hypothetical protein